MISKFLKTVLVILFLCSALSAQTSGLPFYESNINSGLLLGIENTKAAVTLTQIPTQFYRNNDTTITGNITIAWDAPGIQGDFYYSRFPNVTSNLRNLSLFPGDSILDVNSTDNSITFNVGIDSVITGVYYCIIVDPAFGKDSTSIEFSMIIEHDLSPADMVADSTTGNFTWSRGRDDSYTPYFHLIVSNRPLQLTDDDGDGDQEVKGINVIYQAITPNTSITYRDADLSGFYDNSKSPRLASGNDYYWLLFNNYGNNPALSSDLISYSIVPSFTYDNPQTVQPAPQNLEPVSTSLTNLDSIQFQWSSVPGSHYHLYLYEEIEESNNIGSFLVYDTTITTGDTSITVNYLKQLLINTNYYWNVTAENGNLFSASQVDSFDYSTVNSGKLKIETNVAITGTPDLARVNLDIQLLGGSTPSTLTYLTDEKGRFNRELVAGNYIVSASKDGFSQLDTIVTIINNDSTDLILNLVGNPTYFTGKISIPSLNDIPKIKVLSSSVGDTLEIAGNLWSSTTSRAEYTFRVNVEPGDWTLFPIADGFKAAVGDTADTTIFFGNYLEIPYTFLLEEIQSRIIVTVTDDTGGVVPNFNLTFTKAANQQIFNNVTSPFIHEFEPGIWTITIDAIGYFSQSEQYQVEVFDRQDSYRDIIMIEAGYIEGITYDDSGLPLDLVTIQALPQNALARFAETNSALDGTYGPLSLKPGDYQITAEKNGYSSTDTLITVLSNQTIIYNPVLVENRSFVDGIVSDSSGTPVFGARVNYLYDMGTGFSSATDSTGAFLLSVPSNITVKVFATKFGWSTSDTITVTIPENQTETHNFTIFKLNSFVKGTVQTIDQSMLIPMPNVLISAIDTSTQQVIYVDTTDQNGSYKVFVDAGTFWIRAQRQYYITQQDTVTLNNGDSLVVDFILDKNFGSLSGTVMTNTSIAVSNLEVTAERSSTGSVLRDTTDVGGLYTFSDLEPGEVYTINTNKIRHFIAPSDGYTYLAKGGVDTSGFNFVLTLASIDSIHVEFDEYELPNNETTKFDFFAYSNGDQIDIEPPLWSIEYSDTMLFETAKFSTTTNGLFEPKIEALDAGFSIIVEDTGGAGLTKTLDGFSIFSNLNRQMFTNRNIEIKDHTGMVLNIDSTDIIANFLTKIVLKRNVIPESKAISSEAESYGNSYELKVEIGELLDPVIFKLPIPIQVSTSEIENRSQGINVGMWNDNFLEWEILANSDLQTLPYYAVSNSIGGEGEYIVLITSQPLGIHDLKILPNPFSPNLINYNDPLNRNLQGQTIAFDLTSLDIRQPFVSLKIYNMNGELVRELANQEPMTKGQVALIWDGKANNGANARNGRYIVHLKVKDSTGEKEEIKSSVLIK